jgi:hypothetical protein
MWALNLISDVDHLLGPISMSLSGTGGNVLVFAPFVSGKCDPTHHRHSTDILFYFSSLFVDYNLVLYISGFFILILQILLTFYIVSIT